MKKTKIFVLTCLSLFIVKLAYSQVLVLEFLPDDGDLIHGHLVKDIACDDSSYECSTLYTDSFSKESFVQQIEQRKNRFKIINMSFSVFEPSYPTLESMSENNSFEKKVEKYNLALLEFEEDKKYLESLILNSPDILFVIAAGNGVQLEILSTPGVVVSDQNALYPSFISASNTLNVTSLNESEIDMNHLNDHSLARYSNFGLETVDLAAPVPLNRAGEQQFGTSFAAPFMSKLAMEILSLLPELKSSQLKEMMMKSVYIPDLKIALWATNDLKEKGEESIVYKAQYEKSYFKRLDYQAKLKGLFLLKSGGFIVPQLLNECAKNYRDLNLSIEESCLKAHASVFNSNPTYLSDLKELWKIRKF